LVPELDQYSPPERSRHITEGWLNTGLDVLPRADHFLHGATDQVVSRSLVWLRTQFTPAS
jgi:hypothetical protein